MSRVIMTTTILTATIFTTMIAHAKNENSTTKAQSPLFPLYNCLEIADSTKRLDCYDTNVANLRLAEQSEEVVAIDVNTAEQIKREAFGFRLPSLGKIGFPKIGKDEKIDSVVYGVKSIRSQGARHVITLDNGQVWKEVGGHVKRLPKGKLTATIKPKALGSFMMILENDNSRKRSLRARRIK